MVPLICLSSFNSRSLWFTSLKFVNDLGSSQIIFCWFTQTRQFLPDSHCPRIRCTRTAGRCLSRCRSDIVSSSCCSCPASSGTCRCSSRRTRWPSLRSLCTRPRSLFWPQNCWRCLGSLRTWTQDIVLPPCRRNTCNWPSSLGIIVTRKKSPNVNKSCPKMISPEIW